jgi:hypothetical protein
MSTPEEIGRTARLAIQTWGGTARLILLLMALALAAGLFIAVRHLPLTTW